LSHLSKLSQKDCIGVFVAHNVQEKTIQCFDEVDCAVAADYTEQCIGLKD